MALLDTLEAKARLAQSIYTRTNDKACGDAILEAVALLRKANRRQSRRRWEQDMEQAINVLDIGLDHAGIA
jgi:hypothetical protein